MTAELNEKAELNTFLTAESKRRIYARTALNIFRRAATLFEDGYTATETHRGAHSTRFDVRSPKGDFYAVCLSDLPDDDVFGSYCTCPAHEKYGQCKHRIAVEQAASDQAQIDEYARQQEECYDPYEAAELDLERLTAGRTVYGGSLHSEL